LIPALHPDYLIKEERDTLTHTTMKVKAGDTSEKTARDSHSPLGYFLPSLFFLYSFVKNLRSCDTHSLSLSFTDNSLLTSRTTLSFRLSCSVYLLISPLLLLFFRVIHSFKSEIFRPGISQNTQSHRIWMKKEPEGDRFSLSLSLSPPVIQYI
jgi:hypothetical protein